jgi:hypothetical protein
MATHWRLPSESDSALVSDACASALRVQANSALLPDAFSSRRCAYGAAKRGR